MFLSALAVAVAGAACGGASDAPPATTTTPAGQPAGPAAAAEPEAPAVHDGRPIEITGDDTIKFNLSEIRAKAGERVSVTLVNVGKTPKFSMGHNWVLLTAASDPEAFVLAAAESPTTDYIPASRKSEILAATKLLGPNERDTVTFEVPTTPGKYIFLCSFPGHYQVGMWGVLIVE